MRMRPYVIVDLETTGLFPEQDEIIEIAAVILEAGEISGSFSSLVKPVRPIPPGITALTGISDEMVSGAPGLGEVLPELVQFIGDRQIVGHNIGFDLAFLKPFLTVDSPAIDTLEISRIVLPHAADHRLQTVARSLDLAGGTAHRALDDALLTARVFLALCQRLTELPLEVVARINRFSRGWNWPLAGLFQELELALLTRFPDRKISGQLQLRQPQAVQGLFAELPRTGKTEEYVSLEPFLVEETLGKDGALSRKLPGFEYRPQQAEVMAMVIQALNEGKHLVMEAGTGTGKSLAYLIPAINWAQNNGEKVVVSTHTISLQEQLWGKDIPLLQSLLPRPFRAALVKGRGNYLCLRKWFQVEENLESFSAADRRFLIRLVNWLAGTDTGDRGELNLNAVELETWNHIAADSDSCAGSRCRWCHDYCFLMRARREAEKADLLVINHSLLLSDLKSENKVLPEYNHLIIDEAHHLEETATKHLGTVVTRDGSIRLLESLGRESGRTPGYLFLLRKNGERARGLEETIQADLLRRLEETQRAVCDAITAARQFFALVYLGLNNNENIDYSGDRVTRRIRPQDRTGAWWLNLEAERDNFSYLLQALTGKLTGISVLLDDIVGSYGQMIGDPRDVAALAKSVRELDEAVRATTGADDERQVYWLEGEPGNESGHLSIHTAPVEVDGLLSDQIFSRKRSVILTSATLSTAGSFDHFLERTGLHLADPERVLMKSVSSPFQFDEQVLLCIPSDIVPPEEGGDEAYARAVAPVIKDICLAMEGRVMVLFTSYRLLTEIYEQVAADLSHSNIRLLAQRIDGSQARLLEEFQRSDRAVIFGTAGFWEGVDIKGEKLSCVIMVKLPFSPPSLPVIEARMELLQKEQKNGFYHYLLPAAVIRFKQGFGRLIRSGSDHGVVVVLDKRLVDKNYGRKFLASLPVKTHIKGDTPLIVRRIREHMQNGKNAATFPLKLSDTDDIPPALEKSGRRSGGACS